VMQLARWDLSLRGASSLFARGLWGLSAACFVDNSLLLDGCWLRAFNFESQ
jgi:hypothetical protein